MAINKRETWVDKYKNTWLEGKFSCKCQLVITHLFYIIFCVIIYEILTIYILNIEFYEVQCKQFPSSILLSEYINN